MNSFTKKRQRFLCLSIILLSVSLILALAYGTVSISLKDVFDSFFQHDSTNNRHLIIEKIRTPRALLAALVGAMLGICGASSQGLFRNPLADPSLIGVTAGASAGAALFIFFANTEALQGFAGLSLVSVGAFIGGSLAVLVVYKLATNRNGTSVATMLLAGIAIAAIAGGLTSLVEFFANNEMLRRISLWRMGGLEGASYERV